MKKITLSLFLALGTLFASNTLAQCVANGTMTPTGNPGEFIITDQSTISSNGYSYFSGGDGGILYLQPTSTTGTYQYTSNGVYNYYFAVSDSSSAFCWDTLSGTIVVTGITTTPTSCSAAFNIQPDSINTSVYWCWNNSVASSPGIALTYFWDFGDGTTSNLAYPTHVYNTLGFYTICLTISDTSNCTDTYCDSILVSVKSSGTTLNVLPPGASASLDEMTSFSGLTNFPNPTNGLFTIELTAKTESKAQFTVLNVAGQVIVSRNENLNAGNNKIDFNASDLAEGIYLVKVKDVTTGAEQTLRVVKK
ncbi:MAG: PKD domain-containing protein [Crocinitomicaceae bacterium]